MRSSASAFMFVASTLALTAIFGCGDPKKPSESNFTKAIDTHLAANGDACLGFSESFPEDVPERRSGYGPGFPDTNAVLAQAGLLRSSHVVKDEREPFSGTITHTPVTRYELTDKGKQATHTGKGGFFGSRTELCYAREKVDSIVKWTEPANLGPVTLTEVTYTYKLADVADWAKRPDVQKAFSGIQPELSGQSTTQRQADLQLTNKGWEIPER